MKILLILIILEVKCQDIRNYINKLAFNPVFYLRFSLTKIDYLGIVPS
jgi:hypothetical protein